MLEAIETHCSETLCQSRRICRSVSASLGGSARAPPVSFGCLDFFRAILVLLVSAYSSNLVTGRRLTHPMYFRYRS
jgi:hypothetical protein